MSLIKRNKCTGLSLITGFKNRFFIRFYLNLGVSMMPKVTLKHFIDFKLTLNHLLWWDHARTTLHIDGGLDHFFPNSIPLDLAKHGLTIIWRSSKNMNFPKIWRLWLKNCALHIHFNFELLKGVAVLFFEVYPWNFDQLWIFYRQKIDVLFIFLYLQ